MAGTTARGGLLKPTDAESADVDVLNDNFDKLSDYAVGDFICTSTTRPAAPWQGMRIYETDTGACLIRLGTEWRPTNVIICTSSTRPANLVVGQEIFETDTKLTYIYNGTGWVSTSLFQSTWGLTANQAISSGGFTMGAFNNALSEDVVGKFTNNAGAVTINEAGKYVVTVQCNWGSIAAGNRRLCFATKNCPAVAGTGVLNAGEQLFVSSVRPTGVETVSNFKTQPISLAVNDVIRIFLFQDSGANVDVEKGSLTHYLGQSKFAIERVG